MWKQNVDKINDKKVMLIQSFSPRIKLHMLGVPRVYLNSSGRTLGTPGKPITKPYHNWAIQHIIRFV